MNKTIIESLDILKAKQLIETKNTNTHKYTIKVEQTFEVIAKSIQEAYDLLPEYSWSPNPSWLITDETIELKETKDVAID